MPDLTPEQEQERLRLIKQQNEATNELLSTYEKLSTSVNQLKNDEKELVSLSKQLIESSVKVEKSLEKRSETLTSIVNLSKSLNKETLDYNKSLTESVKLKSKLSASSTAKPIVKAPTLPETITQTITPNINVEVPELTVTPKLTLGTIPQLTVTPNLVLGATPQLTVIPNLALVDVPVQTVVPNLVLGPVPQLTVTPNLVLDASPQLTVTPNISVTDTPVQTVVPNLVLGPIPQLTVTPNLAVDVNPILVTPNFILTEAPQQTVTPNLVVADPLAPLTVTPNLQLSPQSEPLFVTPRLLQKPVLDPLFVTPNFKLVPPTEPIEVTPNFQLSALSPLTVTPEIQVQTPVLTVTPEVNVVNPTVTVAAGGTATGPATSSFPFDKTQLTDIFQNGIQNSLKKYERSPSLGVTLDKDKSGLLTKLATTATLIYSEIKKQLGITSPIAAQTPATVAPTTGVPLTSTLPTSPTNTGTTQTSTLPPSTPATSTGGVNLSGSINVPNPKTAQEFEEAIRLANKQLQQVGGFTVDVDTEIRNASGDTAKLEKLLKKINGDFNNITSNANYLYSTLRDIVAELKNQNVVLSAGNKAFDNLVKTAQDINYQQQGLNDLTDKQFKKLKENIGLQQKELEFVIRRLAVNEDINGAFKYQATLDRLRAKSADDLTTREKARLKELEKEQALLINAQQTLKSGIPLLQEELNLSKQISDTRSNLGGIAKGASELLSKFGGGLSKYLNISEATDAVNEYNKKLVDGALNSKEVKEALIEIEKERNRLQGAYNAGQISQIELEKQLLNLDVKSNKVKQEAVNSLNTFGNKLNSLTVFAKEAGKGITKLFSDPIILMTTLVELGFKANKQVVELGKSFGLSAKAAENIRQEVAQFSRETGDTFVNTDRLLKAQAELSQEMGMAVKYSNEELVTFAKLTELTGLTAQEAGKLAQASAATGMSTEAYTDKIREGAFSAMQATKTHFSMKEVMQDISKLSAGTLIKFQGNPKALAATVVEAKKLGLTLEQVNKTGDSLLNFESSIESELKAELMTGKQLNMERARAAALAGDQATLTKEIGEQVGTLNDYQNMNVLAQQSLAEAFGMSRDEMSEMLMKQEAINQYGEQAGQLNKEQLEEMKRKGLSASEYIQQQEQQRAAQDKFNDAMTKLQDIIGNLVAGPVGQLLDALANMVGVAMKLLSFLKPVFNIIAYAAEGISDFASTPFGGIIAGLTGIYLLSGKIAAGLGSMGRGIMDFGKGIISSFKGGSTEGGGFLSRIKKSFKGGLTGGGDKAAEAAETGTKGAETAGSTAGKSEAGGDGSKFKTKMQNIADGIKAFADKDVLKGALYLIPASIGLLLFAPGVLGIKAIEQVKGEKFQEAMYGIAYGIADFGKNVTFGALAKLALGGIALTAFALGVPGILFLQLVNGDKFQSSMEGIGLGIASFSEKVSAGALVKLLFGGIALTAFALGVPALLLLQFVNGSLIEKTLTGVGKGIKGFSENVSYGDLIKGAVAIALFGASLIPFAFALNMLADVKMENILAAGAGLLIFGAAVFGLGALMMGPGAFIFGAGILALIALGGAMMILGQGLKVVSEGGAGIATLFQQLSELDASKLDAVAPALKTIGEAIMYLGAGGVLSALGNLLGGDSPAKMIQEIAETGPGLTTASTSLQTLASAFKGLAEVEISKLEPIISIFDKIKEGLLALGEVDESKLEIFKNIVNSITPIFLLLEKIEESKLTALGGIANSIVSMFTLLDKIDEKKLAIFSIITDSIALIFVKLNEIDEKKLEILNTITNSFASIFIQIEKMDEKKLSIFGSIMTSIQSIFTNLEKIDISKLLILGILTSAITTLFGVLNIIDEKKLLGLSLITDSINKTFDALNKVDVGKLFAIGPALASVGFGLMALGTGGVISAIGSFLGGDPIEKIERLANAGDGLIKTSSALQGVASALTQLSTSLNTLDTSKLEKIAEMSSGGGVIGFLNNIFGKITSVMGGSEASSPVASPEITTTPILAPSNTANTNTTTPSTITSTSIQPNLDLTPMITAINEVKASIDKLYNKNTSINMDGTKVGTTLTQGSYKVA